MTPRSPPYTLRPENLVLQVYMKCHILAPSSGEDGKLLSGESLAVPALCLYHPHVEVEVEVEAKKRGRNSVCRIDISRSRVGRSTPVPLSVRA